MTNIENCFGRKNGDGNVDILHIEEGAAVTRLDANVYPVGSNFSAKYEHSEGIVLTADDAESVGIKIEP